MARPAFNTFARKGFQMTFPNGLTVSVMFGSGNYCEHRFNRDVEPLFGATVPVWGRHGSEDAEVAVIAPDGEFMDGFPHCPDCDHVVGWLTPSEVLEVMQWAATQPAPVAA